MFTGRYLNPATVVAVEDSIFMDYFGYRTTSLQIGIQDLFSEIDEVGTNDYYLNGRSSVEGVIEDAKGGSFSHDQEMYCLNNNSNDRRLESLDNGICKTKKKKKKANLKKETCKNVKKGNVIKGQWTLDEDRLLIRLVDRFGLRKWSHIVQMLKGRVGKHCRERWHNHLRPNIKKDIWTEEEERMLIAAHLEIQNRWADEIAKIRLPGRTENSIKNHWNATKRRQLSSRRTKSSDSNQNPKPFSVLQQYIKSLGSVDPTSSLPSLPPTINQSKIIEYFLTKLTQSSSRGVDNLVQETQQMDAGNSNPESAGSYPFCHSEDLLVHSVERNRNGSDQDVNINDLFDVPVCEVDESKVEETIVQHEEMM